MPQSPKAVGIAVAGPYPIAGHRPELSTLTASPKPCPIAAAATHSSASSATPTSGSLTEYILQGPLLPTCGITQDDVLQQAQDWVRLGQLLAQQMGFDHENLDAAQRLRIYHYYLPVFFWMERQLAAHKAAGSKTALVMGISAPQGCGKTTLVEQLQELFAATGRCAASVSIDDFYLTYKDQSALAAANPSNPLLRYRGNAGTHDLKLGTDTLMTLRDLTQSGQSAAVPRYDKSAYSGRGDRGDASTWPRVSGPVDIVLFEGWMSGFAPTTDEEVSKVDPALVAVNQALKGYQSAWDDLVDSWLVVRIGNPDWVYKWRLQAEERMRASGKAGMTDEQIADFVNRFMPAYRAYLPRLYQKGPTTARAGRTLIIEVDQNRSPVSQQPAPVV